MDDQKQIAISVLRKTLAANSATIERLEEENEHLESVIQQLEADSSAEARVTPPPAIDRRAMNEIFFQLEGMDEGRYAVGRLKGLTRIEIAKVIAQDFNGFVSTGAFKRVLAKPGVLTSAKQVGSVASRVLMHSDEFERVWEGLYKLKNYSPNGKVPVQEKSQLAN